MKNQTHKAWQKPMTLQQMDEICCGAKPKDIVDLTGPCPPSPRTEPIYYIECGYGGKTQRTEFDYIDPDIDDWISAFKVILKFLTFSTWQIENQFLDRDNDN